MSEKAPNKQINIELGEKEAEGIYSNLALISHSPAEFVIDFTRVLPGTHKTKIYSRIIMTPQHAKCFMKALEENIAKYEKQFGEITIHQTQVNMPQKNGFNTTQNGKNKAD